MNKIITTSCIYLLIVTLANAQTPFSEKIVIPLSNPGERGRIEIDQVNGNITVTGYTGKEVIITASTDTKVLSINHDCDDCESKNIPAGMKKIEANPVEIHATEKNNVVSIDTESWKKKINLVVQVPADFDLGLSTVHGAILVNNVSGAMEISAVNGGVELTNVSGSVVSNSVNGDIKVLFKNIKAGVPMSFVTLNGSVDVTLPPATKALLKLRSERGDIYTDFDMALEQVAPKVNKNQGEYEVSINSWVYGKINGGGPEFTLKNMHGNIIVRKGT